MSRKLVVGDTHMPVDHPGYLQFCLDIYDQWDCDSVAHIGDLADFQAISFHANNPMCPGPNDEFFLTKSSIQRWYRAFTQQVKPESFEVCIGNHDERLLRLAESVNIPSRFLRDYAEIWSTPKWEYGHVFIDDGVYYFHGTAMGGLHPAWNAAGKMLMPTVMGHIHSAAGVSWRANPLRRIFSMDVGCGIDIDAYQFAYGRHVKKRPILSCGVVIDGIPYHEVMPCGTGELYHKSNFKEKN